MEIEIAILFIFGMTGSCVKLSEYDQKVDVTVADETGATASALPHKIKTGIFVSPT